MSATAYTTAKPVTVSLAELEDGMFSGRKGLGIVVLMGGLQVV